MPGISVVIPLFNKGSDISRAMKSVLSQTYENFEVIVVDDGSSDDGADIVRGFNDPRIHLVQQENKGVSVARNRGIKLAEADHIAFLDADDEWLDGHLEELSKLIQKYPNAGIYALAFDSIIDTNGGLIHHNFHYLPDDFFEGELEEFFLYCAIGEACGQPPLSSSSVCVSKKILTEFEGFKEGESWGEDTDLWGRIATKYPIVFSRRIGAIYHKEGINHACKSGHYIRCHPFESTILKLLDGDIQSYNSIEFIDELLAMYQLLTIEKNLWAPGRENQLKRIITIKTKLFKRKKIFLLLLSIIPMKVSSSMLRSDRISINIFRRLKECL